MVGGGAPQSPLYLTTSVFVFAGIVTGISHHHRMLITAHVRLYYHLTVSDDCTTSFHRRDTDVVTPSTFANRKEVLRLKKSILAPSS